jgi:hypothetical protein
MSHARDPEDSVSADPNVTAAALRTNNSNSTIPEQRATMEEERVEHGFAITSAANWLLGLGSLSCDVIDERDRARSRKARRGSRTSSRPLGLPVRSTSALSRAASRAGSRGRALPDRGAQEALVAGLRAGSEPISTSGERHPIRHPGQSREVAARRGTPPTFRTRWRC